MTDALIQAKQCYDQALGLRSASEIAAHIQQGINLLDGLSGSAADRQRLALLDLELQTQSSASYLPPPASVVQQFAALAAQTPSPIFRARAQHYEAVIVWSTRSFVEGRDALRQAFEALVACGDIEGQFHALGNLGLFSSVTGDVQGGIALMRDGLKLYEQLDPARRDLPVIQAARARLMLRLALNLFDLDYISESLIWLAQARQVYEDLGQLYGCTTEYAQLYARVGYWQESECWALMGMQTGVEAADRAYAQIIYGFILGQQGKYAEAIAQIEQALVVVTQPGSDHWLRALASVYLADMLLQPGLTYNPEAAESLSDTAFDVGEAGNIHYGSIYALTNKARLASTRGDNERAALLACDAANRMRARHTLTLVREEEVLYWEYRLLDAAGRDGHGSLADAYQRLQTAALRIEDPAMRESFLNHVPLHCAIVAEYAAVSSHV